MCTFRATQREVRISSRLSFFLSSLLLLFCGCTPHSGDADSDATVPGELHSIYS